MYWININTNLINFTQTDILFSLFFLLFHFRTFYACNVKKSNIGTTLLSLLDVDVCFIKFDHLIYLKIILFIY